MQQWINIDEAVRYAKLQHATPGSTWPTVYLTIAIAAGLLITGSVPVIMIGLRRRRITPANGQP